MTESSSGKSAYIQHLVDRLQSGFPLKHESGEVHLQLSEYLSLYGATPYDADDEELLNNICRTCWWEEQIPLLKRAILHGASSVRYWSYLGRAYSFLGQYEQAEKSFDKGLLIDEKDFGCLYGKATTYADMSRYDDAVASYRKCLSLEEHEYIHPMIGYCLAHMNHYREAVEEICIGLDYYKTHSLRHSLIDTTSVLCGIHIRYSRPQKALSCVNSALHQYSDSSRLHILKGDIYAYMKNEKKAYRSYYDGIILSRDRLKAVKHIGMNLFSQGEYMLAERILYFVVRDLEFGEEHTLLDESTLYQSYRFLYAYWSFCQYKLGHHQQFLLSFEKGLSICPQTMQKVFAPIIPAGFDLHTFFDSLCDDDIHQAYFFPEE